MRKHRPIYSILDSQLLFDSLMGANYFSDFDLSSGYCNLEIEEEDKEKTAFATRSGLFEFNQLPFGLCGVPATFQRLTNLILRKTNFEKCVAYLDYIIIYCRNIKEHNERLITVFIKIRETWVKQM